MFSKMYDACKQYEGGEERATEIERLERERGRTDRVGFERKNDKLNEKCIPNTD